MGAEIYRHDGGSVQECPRNQSVLWGWKKVWCFIASCFSLCKQHFLTEKPSENMYFRNCSVLQIAIFACLSMAFLKSFFSVAKDILTQKIHLRLLCSADFWYEILLCKYLCESSHTLWRFHSIGMWHFVFGQVISNVLKGCSAFIFRVKYYDSSKCWELLVQ